MYEIAGKKIPSTLAEIAEPSQTALLIWDMEYAIARMLSITRKCCPS